MSSSNPSHSTTGSAFVAVPSVFEGTSSDIANALKFQLIPKIISKTNIAGENGEIALDVDVVSNHALIDFKALENLNSIDYSALEMDCEIFKESLRSHREIITLALKTVNDPNASPETIEEVAAKLKEAGLTERGFRERGGGFIGLLVAIAAVLVLEGCRGCAHLTGAVRTQQPDAGPT